MLIVNILRIDFVPSSSWFLVIFFIFLNDSVRLPLISLSSCALSSYRRFDSLVLCCRLFHARWLWLGYPYWYLSLSLLGSVFLLLFFFFVFNRVYSMRGGTSATAVANDSLVGWSWSRLIRKLFVLLLNSRTITNWTGQISAFFFFFFWLLLFVELKWRLTGSSHRTHRHFIGMHTATINCDRREYCEPLSIRTTTRNNNNYINSNICEKNNNNKKKKTPHTEHNKCATLACDIFLSRFYLCPSLTHTPRFLLMKKSLLRALWRGWNDTTTITATGDDDDEKNFIQFIDTTERNGIKKETKKKKQNNPQKQ